MGKAVGWTFVMLVLFTSCRTVQSNYANRGFLRASEPTEQFPFQVLHADSSRIVGTESFLSRLNYVAADDFIKVKNGHLILVHYSGKFLEFEKDTILNVREINDWLIDTLNLSEEVGNYRPNLEMLYSKDKSSYYSAVGAVSCRWGIIELIGEQEYSINANIEDLCLAWYSLDNINYSPYQVSFKNIFDETIYNLTTDDSKLKLDLSPYDSLFDGGLAILEISSTNSEYALMPPFGIRFHTVVDFHPSICNIESAIDALEFASFLEWKGYQKADDYFIQAVGLSDKKIYEELKQLNVR